MKVDMQSMQSQQHKIKLHYGLQPDKSNCADNILSSIAIGIWVWRPNKVSVIISDVHAWSGIANLVKGLVTTFQFQNSIQKLSNSLKCIKGLFFTLSKRTHET